MANFLAVLEGKNPDPLSFLNQASESLSLPPFSLLTAFPYKFDILSQHSVFFGQIPAFPRKVTHINHLRALSPFPLYLWLRN
jgi:hypothetical protein